MKVLRSIILGIAALIAATQTLAAPDATKTVFNIVVAPEFRSRTPEVESLVSSLLFSMSQGDTLLVTSAGSEPRRVAAITLDADLSENPTARLKGLKKLFSSQLAAIHQFAAGLPANPQSGQSGNLVRFAKSLEWVGREYPGQKIKVAYLGSPIVQEPSAWSMATAYPMDGALTDPHSPYAATSGSQVLKNVELHVVHSANLAEFAKAYPDGHNATLRRFYSLYCRQLGGVLASWSGQSEHLAKLKTNQYPPISANDVNKDAKSGMAEIRSPVQIKADDDMQSVLWAQMISKNPPPPSHLRSKASMGITWNCAGCDLDLYVRADGDNEELSFAHQSSNLGRHLKDLRDMTPSNRGYETVIFPGAVDLDRLKVAINHYSGSATAAAIDIQFRIQTDEGLYFKNYRMKAGDGTKSGGSRDGTGWVKVNVKEVLGL